MNDDDLELASSYLDDEVTDDERARVEASAELRRLVDELRAVRVAAGDIDPPSAASREAAVAAALAVFDEHQPAPPPNVVPIERAGRWRWRHGLGVAAAAVVVVVGGLAVLRDDAEAPSDLQSAGGRSTSASSLVPAVAEFDADAGDEAESATAAAGANESADAAPATATTPAPPGAPAPAAALDESPATTTSQLARISSAAELAALADRLIDDRGTPLPDRRDAREQCRDDEDRARPTLVADAVFIDEDGTTHAIVVVDDNGEAAGLDLDSCDLVVRAGH